MHIIQRKFIFYNSNQLIEKDNKCDDEHNEDKIKKKENQKSEILNEVRNVVFALLNPTSTFFAYIIASSILNDKLYQLKLDLHRY